MHANVGTQQQPPFWRFLGGRNAEIPHHKVKFNDVSYIGMCEKETIRNIMIGFSPKHKK